MMTEHLSEEFITKENMTPEQLSEIGIKNLNALTETLKNEKDVNFYQLIFVATMINDIVVIPKKYYIPCDEIANVIKNAIETLERKDNLDHRAYFSLAKASEELIKKHQISESTLDDLNKLKSEYYNTIYRN